MHVFFYKYQLCLNNKDIFHSFHCFLDTIVCADLHDLNDDVLNWNMYGSVIFFPEYKWILTVLSLLMRYKL